MKTLVWVAVAVVVVVFFANAWEQWPLLDRAAGVWRFRQLVANPIPSHIHQVRGGFRGWWRDGYIFTRFEFEPPLGRHTLLEGWEKTDTKTVGPILEVLVKPYLAHIAEAYTKPVHPSGGSSTWLLIDQESRKGVLYSL
jgi:hypothetical protein